MHILRGRMETFPFLGLPVSVLPTSAVWQVLTHDAYVPSSNILTLDTRSRRHRPWSFGPGTLSPGA